MKITTNQVDSYLNKIENEKIVGCLLYGPKESLARYRFEFIAKKIVQDLSDPFLVTQLTTSRIKEDPALIADEFYSISMMGGRKLIMIKDCDAAVIAGLKILFEDGQYGRKSNNFILLLAGDLDKSSSLRKIIEDTQFMMALPCYEDNALALKKYLQDIITQNGLVIETKVVDLLIKNFAFDRNLLKNEMDKIICYLGDSKKLEEEDFKKICSITDEDNLQDFAIQFANKNYEWCLNSAATAFKKSNESIMLVRYLIIYFTKLYNGKVALEKGVEIDEIIRSQQVFFKIQADYKNQLRNLSQKFVVKSLQSFENLEVNLKKGNIPQTLVFLNYLNSFISLKKR